LPELRSIATTEVYENRALISLAHFMGANENLGYATELLFVLLDGIFYIFLPYSESQDIIINHYILS